MGASFSSCTRLWNVLCLCLPNSDLPAKAALEHCHEILAIDFALKISYCCLEQLSRVMARWGQMTSRGSNLDSSLKSVAWPTSCNGFCLLWNYKINFVEFEFFLGLWKISNLQLSFPRLPELVKTVQQRFVRQFEPGPSRNGNRLWPTPQSGKVQQIMLRC